MRGKLLQRVSARGHSDGARADCLAALNVVGRVTDDKDILRGKFAVVVFPRPPPRVRPEFIPQGGVVGESAKFKK